MINTIRKSILVVVLGICFCVFCGFDDNKETVYDKADLLNEHQKHELKQECIRIGEKYEIEIIILTNNKFVNMSSERYVEDFVIKNDIGYKEKRTDKACIVYLINMYNQDVYMYLGGVTQYYLDSKWDRITKTSVSYISEGDYYNACTRFLSDTEYYIGKKYDKFQEKYQKKWDAYSGNYDSFENKYIKSPFFSFLKDPLYCALIAFATGLILVVVMEWKNRTHISLDCDTYMDEKTFRMNKESDNLVRTVTVDNSLEIDPKALFVRSRKRKSSMDYDVYIGDGFDFGSAGDFGGGSDFGGGISHGGGGHDF